MRQAVYRSRVILILLLAGCLSTGARQNLDASLTVSEEPAANSSSGVAVPTPTAVIAAAKSMILDDETSLIASPPPAPDPLEFIFPTAEPEAVSLWRPPLYPTPWEPTPNDHFYFTRPIGANDVNWPLARYRYGYLLYSEPHTGIDIPAPKGTPIMAAGSGTVIHAGYGLYFVSDVYKDPYGIAVAIKHDFGYKGKTLYTIYGHLDRVDVYRGQKVMAGEVIGLVGETGKVSGPHLHMEVRIGDNNFFSSRNPELWISPPQGWGILVGRVVETSGRKIPQVKARLVRIDTQRVYEVISYAQGSANSDDYYDENLALGDLPAGFYLFYLDFEGQSVKTELEIRPGEVTYFEYRSTKGFDFTRPPTKGPAFIPPDITDTPVAEQPSPNP